ncbi:hypothetical protein CC1G_15098 [Coprinopsis cinerea okayama7|uniref:Uncharacterized protein n=1 Tax=Coprinopsis cinerea (strain Okayama-7 / 130 / ATCC MYA-4618 / FGSC 9003) TaxID=240176 RepID=D6RNZ4_COPC7|nr:hypothetical protein CC1G_15098 [Coprinopsis cinerea okayama7\|eukprot:XP_002910764.1 hypothetical protein CC1G_15098 [Coprinopsis cinerea okayama7\
MYYLDILVELVDSVYEDAVSWVSHPDYSEASSKYAMSATCSSAGIQQPPPGSFRCTRVYAGYVLSRDVFYRWAHKVTPNYPPEETDAIAALSLLRPHAVPHEYPRNIVKIEGVSQIVKIEGVSQIVKIEGVSQIVKIEGVAGHTMPREMWA